jgi:hypothetical protein
VNQLLELNNPAAVSEKALIGSLSLTDVDSVTKVAEDVITESSADGLWTTYLTGINNMTQGGFRDGQLAYIEALQHNNKSGLLLGLLATLPFLNKPRPSERPGIPTIVLFSFEDSLTKILGDLYGIIKMYQNPNHDRIELDELHPDEIKHTILEAYKDTGWDFVVHRIDPSDFTYNDLFNFVNELEIKGASVRELGMDYLSQISKGGCIKDGPMGTDLRDLIKRVKNWIASKDIMGISAHQLNQAAKRLKQEGVPDHEFLEKIVGLGYTEASGQIDQELDLEILINLIKANGKTYMGVTRGKHKLNSVIKNHEDLSFVVKLPDNGNKLAPDVLEGQKPMCFPTFEEAVSGSNVAEDSPF